MKALTIRYTAQRPFGPMTAWVHHPVEPGVPLRDAKAFEPPTSARQPAGYPVVEVEIDGFTFVFCSIHEARHLIEMFERKVLPPTVDGRGNWSNQHWLSRLPAHVKALRYRQKAAAYLRRIMPEIAAALPP